MLSPLGFQALMTMSSESSVPDLEFCVPAVVFSLPETSCGNIPYGKYMAAVKQSGWLQSLHQLLTTGARVAQRLLCGESVLVQCASGLDQSAQVSCLNMGVLSRVNIERFLS